MGFGDTIDDLKKFEQGKDSILNSVKSKFSPEFLNRLDNVVLFNALGQESIEKIVKLQLSELPIRRTKPLIKYIIDGGYSVEYGARNIARFIKNNKKVYDYKIVNNSVEILNTEKFKEKTVDASG